jgi:hypothetical protein
VVPRPKGAPLVQAQLRGRHLPGDLVARETPEGARAASVGRRNGAPQPALQQISFRRFAERRALHEHLSPREPEIWHMATQIAESSRATSSCGSSKAAVGRARRRPSTGLRKVS